MFSDKTGKSLMAPSSHPPVDKVDLISHYHGRAGFLFFLGSAVGCVRLITVKMLKPRGVLTSISPGGGASVTGLPVAA